MQGIVTDFWHKGPLFLPLMQNPRTISVCPQEKAEAVALWFTPPGSGIVSLTIDLGDYYGTQKYHYF